MKTLPDSSDARQLSLWQADNSVVDPVNEPREVVSRDGVRGVLLNGVPHVSIVDAYRNYGHSTNPARDWANDLKKLRQQGYDTEIVSFSFEKNGKRTKPTPVVTDEQLARIAQVAEFKEWEPIRQEMARLFVARKRQQPPPVKQSKAYLHARHSGYTETEAIAAAGVREKLRTMQLQTNSVRQEHGAQGADFGKLNALDSEVATGKSPSRWKQDRGVDDTPANTHSAIQNAMLYMVKRESVKLHIRNNSRGLYAMMRDVRSLEEQTASIRESLESLLSDLPIELPAPKGKQLSLESGE